MTGTIDPSLRERPSHVTLEIDSDRSRGALMLEISDSRGTRLVPLSARAGVRLGSSLRRVDVTITDPTVSGVHCEVRLDQGRVHIRDLGSRNGTYAGGARIAGAIAGPGAVFMIGRTAVSIVTENEELADCIDVPALPAIAGASLAMRRLARDVRRLATHHAPALIRGETGCGKELVARAIHTESGSTGDFVAVNVASLPRDLVESELFGHERGAFTSAVARRRGAFEMAANGTVFLDEIGELPAEAQPKLLRALDGYEVRRVGEDGAGRALSARVVAATHVDLREAVAIGEFRRDLFHRLEVFVVNVPPLRAHKSDIHAIARVLLRHSSFAARDLTPDALAVLIAHEWPGNVRELRNVLVRASAEDPRAEELTAWHIVRSMRESSGPAAVVELTPASARAILEDCDGNWTKAAQLAKLPRTTFRRLVDSAERRTP